MELLKWSYPVIEPNKRGRPAGSSVEKSCPHKWDECNGPLAFIESSKHIVSALRSYEETLLFSSMVERSLSQSLHYIGMFGNKSVKQSCSLCPYGLQCVSPILAGKKILEIEPILIQAESIIAHEYGLWMTSGRSPIYELSRMVQVFGFHKESVIMLDQARERMRMFRVNNIID